MLTLCLLATQDYTDQHPCLWCSIQLLHHIFLVWSIYCPEKAYGIRYIPAENCRTIFFQYYASLSNSLALCPKLIGKKRKLSRMVFQQMLKFTSHCMSRSQKDRGRKMSNIPSIMHFWFDNSPQKCNKRKTSRWSLICKEFHLLEKQYSFIMRLPKEGYLTFLKSNQRWPVIWRSGI